MNTETKCLLAEQLCEMLIGGAIGVVLVNNVFPKCNDNAEKVIVSLGTGVVSWAAGRAFAKKFFNYCDNTFGTDFKDACDKL